MSQVRKQHPIPILLALLIAACEYDNPAEIEDVPVAADAFNEFASTANADAEGQDVELLDLFLPRLALKISPESDLVPNQPVKLRIEGTAVGRVDSGIVTARLPTQAGMAYAGRGKFPYYPAVRKLPEAGQWSLPAMDAGDSWETRITVTFPQRGYYGVSAVAKTNGPSQQPNVVTDLSITRGWMFVTDGGGEFTGTFDASMFPDRHLAMPGPFRDRPSRGGGPHSASSASGRLYFSVVYEDANGHYEPAVGATVTGDIRDPHAPDEDWGTHYQSLTVPESGIVSWPCPNGVHYVKGRTYLAQTDFITGNQFAGNFEGTGCNDTISVEGDGVDYLPWANLDAAIPRINTHFDQSRSRVKWEVDMDRESSVYRRTPWSEKIIFGSRSYWSEWVAGHEYTHALQNESLGGSISTSNCSDHTIYTVSSYTCALSEGLADYGGTVGSPVKYADCGVPSWESFYSANPGTGDRGEVEGYVAALFHDLTDGGTETDDQTDYPGSYIANIYRTCEVKVRQKLLPDTWRRRETVADIVWCLEERVNETVHENQFPGVGYRLSDAREGASRPSGWNADNIRTTWIKNVGNGGER